VKFKRLQDQILAFFLTLLMLILMVTMLLVDRVNQTNARTQVNLNIQANADVFIQAVQDRTQQLFESARLLSSDFAFKRAFATRDRSTILSAMQNHLDRMESADIMLLLDIDEGTVIANTSKPKQIGIDSIFPKLLQEADESDYGEAASLVLLDNEVYQFIVGFLLTPEPSAWIAIGFRVDANYVKAFEQLSRSEVSLVYQKNGQQQLFASTLEQKHQSQLQHLIHSSLTENKNMMVLGNEAYVTHIRTLPNNIELSVKAIIQRPLAEALEPYEKLRMVLIILFFISLFIALWGGIYISRRITKPIRVLTDCAKSVQHGHFEGRVVVDRSDEVGMLSEAFNHMLTGLEERDKVNSLLGKVVSPEIAHELLEKGMALGGEEKEVTVLFSDIRNFTNMCEGQSATNILTLLNLYLSEMSDIVEANHGVVDKYIGDAIMALFGAPLTTPEAPTFAVSSALAMIDGLDRVNTMFSEKNIPHIDIGIGINTDIVVAGNMGSQNRLNYTVIGDGVNLSARLEGLTKFYGLKILVSESTRNKSAHILYREIDTVKVKGKDQAVTIYEPYQPDRFDKDDILQYEKALELYQSKQWGKARTIFQELATQDPNMRIYSIYTERCSNLIATEPSIWDGVHTFDSK